jgi:hypothetical protein
VRVRHSTSAYIDGHTTRPVIGYREWVLLDSEIVSPLAHVAWDAGPMRAECVAGCRAASGLWRHAAAHTGPAPDPSCVCGIYALFAPQRPRARDRLAVVRGGVALWGRIELHRRGMRAEFAQIVTLALPTTRTQAEKVAEVARLLDVEIVSARHLGAAALAHGDPLEPALIPR